MSRIKIITDSTAYVTKEYANKNRVEIVPLSVNFCGEINKEGFPGEFNEFYEKLVNTKEFPTTSQPSTGDFIEAYKKAFETGDEIIVLTISSELSGTYNSARLGADMLETDKITVIDSKTSAGNLKLLVEKAVLLVEQGFRRAEIEKEILIQIKNMSINLTVDTLEYLKRGGRLSNATAFIGTLLNIKPVIGLINGKLEPIGKERGKKRAMEAIISMVPENVKIISIAHVQNIKEAEAYKAQLEKKFTNAIITIDELGPVIGSHIGPKAIGLCASW
ncbi:EDD domain protein, DegV family [Proteiniborus ethanoligenes]|uniref:EDD domain protein, DegV family n=1 Tax=Proteiniborus ethanoligenes TaxID=415015 RepID=A0A1H3Q030_9FIRM|nr:DegV family protein [Proteiniborus ethanoligenes]SDZ06583.1 EDD domain protein, DegV family [Proteiniborus ethanoligenes]